MLITILLCAFGLIFPSARALNPTASDGNILEQRQNAYTPVLGVQSGGVQPRLEVRTMFNTQPLQWNLFLLAMQRFQSQPQSSKLSYYQIAGIHGVPNIPWDGVTQNPSSQGAVGYCTHSSVLFPAWHRPYIALFEQVFYDNVQAIVQTFPAGPTRDGYAAAASTIRYPFWDWAVSPPAGLPTFPLIISSKYATVTTPRGQQTILNPLFRYDFHPLVPSDMLYQPWTQWPVTLRWPTNNGSAGLTPASSQNNLAQNAIENSRLSRRDSVYNLFAQCTSYLEFSNDAAASSSPGCHTSLESIHNQIHSLVGGTNNGHMTWLWWGSFDPVFFMHHANVDRLFAMWQAVYPNSYGASQIAPGSTFTIAQGSNQTADSPLTPFHANTSGAFWTTNSVRNTTTFGYTYPELINITSTASMISTINRLYGPNATTVAGTMKARRDLATDPASDVGQTSSDASVVRSLVDTNQHVQYIANIVYPRWTLDGSYTIYLFIGKPKVEDGSAYPFDNHLIGSIGVLSTPGRTTNQLMSAGSIPLTRALNVQIGGSLLRSLERLFVIPFLQKALQWRVATADGRVVSNDAVSGLEVSVVSADFTPPSSPDRFPTFNSWSTLPDITMGKAGGLRLRSRAVCETSA